MHWVEERDAPRREELQANKRLQTQPGRQKHTPPCVEQGGYQHKHTQDAQSKLTSRRDTGQPDKRDPKTEKQSGQGSQKKSEGVEEKEQTLAGRIMAWIIAIFVVLITVAFVAAVCIALTMDEKFGNHLPVLFNLAIFVLLMTVAFIEAVCIALTMDETFDIPEIATNRPADQSG